MNVVCLWFSKPAPVQKVAENCLRFSPQICIRSDRAVFIEIGKCKKIYSTATFLARLQVVLRKLKITAEIGFGESLIEALLRAKFAKLEIGSLPLGSLLDFVDPFDRDPIAKKYVLKMISSFQDLGIHTIEQFKKIPTNELTSRFGAIGILCSQRVKLSNPIAWPYWKPEEIISEKEEFPYFEFYGELEPILFSLKKQLDQIFYRLNARSLKLQELKLTIYCERTSLVKNPNREYHFEFLFPQSSTKGALNVIKERLSREFAENPITTPIEGLESIVTKSVQSESGQKNLLHSREEAIEQLHSLLNQLREAHGSENVFKAELTENRLPEKSWQRATVNSQTLDPDLLAKIPIRPTYLISPEKIEVINGSVVLRKKHFKIGK